MWSTTLEFLHLHEADLLYAILIATLCVDWWMYWRMRRAMLRQLAEAKGRVDELAGLLALEHDTNYRLACQMHGRAAVDKAIALARSRGTN